MTLRLLLLISLSFHTELFLLQVCDGEVLYVTPTPTPNSNCHDGAPCHTLQYYFTNTSLLEQRHDFTMIFLSGRHAEFCQKTTIQANSFNATGVDNGVTMWCTNIELTHAAAVYFESVILDHCYISCQSSATLGLNFCVSLVVAQNQTQVYLRHRKVQGNFIALNNSVFRNSSLFGILYFRQSLYKMGVMNLVSSILTLEKNSQLIFDHNIVQYGALYLNTSTLNVKNAQLSFFNNQIAVLLNRSALNIVKSNVTFMSNSARQTEQGGALFAFASIVNINSTEMSFFNNSGQIGGALYLDSSTFHFTNNTKVTYKNNSATTASAVFAQLSSLNCVKNKTKDSLKVAGGAVAMIVSTFVIRHGTRIIFTDNWSYGRAGAVDVGCNSTMIMESNTNITFISNSAGLVGGAINANLSTFIVSSGANVDFINSYSGYQSAGLAVQMSTINIESNAKITFKNSRACVVGAMSLLSSVLNVKNATMTFTDNFAIYQTGALDAQNSSVIKIDNCAAVTFMNNLAEFRVGAMNLEFASTLIIGYGVQLSFTNNSGHMGSTALNLNRASKLNVTFGASLSFRNNGHNRNPFAGALVLFQHSTMNIENGSSLIFLNNSASSGGAIVTMLSSTFIDSGTTVTFINNSAVTSGGAAYITLSDISVGSGVKLIFINNSAEMAGGGILLLSSKLIVKDNVNMMFIGNSAYRGGAMALLSTQMTFKSADSPNMTFINNFAGKYGGAIYVNPDRLQAEYAYIQYTNYVRCVYYFDSDTESTAGTNYNFYFTNNSAEIGYDIYGASLKLCKGSVAHFESNPGLSAISGHPTRVCRCTEHHLPQCDNPFINDVSTYNIYPSETFTVSVVVVGGDLGTTTGMVHASFRQPNVRATLEPESQRTQYINSTECTALSYNVYSKQSVQLTLSAYLYHDVYSSCVNNGNYDPNVCQHFFPLSINLNVLPCPPGFSLQGDPPGCDCYTVLGDSGVKCNIKYGTLLFSWSTALWMSIENNDTMYSENCPFDYCSEDKSMESNNSDVQCAFNHAGRLCGSCKENYSLAIGSSHCISCSSNKNLVLLIYFATAGFLLVLFVGILNLTVTQGMINGLIFYANIVWMYESILFPAKMHGKLFFFKIFIAWLNLDFGIETCFIKDLNAFLKTWLQFVFPLYIWSIIGLMIIMARYSTRVTKLFGERAVPILATIILLSYNKLLKSAIEILDFSVISVYSEWNVTKPVMVVWSVDGTFEYF